MLYPFGLKRYPTHGSVTRYRGFDGSGSSFLRSWPMKKRRYSGGSCDASPHTAVPESWAVSDDARLTLAPDGSSLSFSVVRIASWSAHKAQLRAALRHVTVVHDDSEHRLWIEIAAQPRARHYID